MYKLRLRYISLYSQIATLTDHDGGFDGRSPGPIGERARDGEVSVEADDEQIKDRRVAREIIEG